MIGRIQRSVTTEIFFIRSVQGKRGKSKFVYRIGPNFRPFPSTPVVVGDVHYAAAAAAAATEQTRGISRALIEPSVSNASHRRYEKTVI